MFFLRILALLTLTLDLSLSLDNNACKTIEDYFDNIKENPNCWFDRDVNTTPEQLARNNGFLLERHTIITDDKYILTTFRVKILTDVVYGKDVIFLQHGMGLDAEFFMGNGNKSIAFFLFEQGFDVWIGNFRGSEYSRHESLSRNNPKFWNFCIHDHGMYDLAANFKYINKETKKQIIYLGHSMGGTAFCIYSSMRPEETKWYIKHAILLATSVYLRNMNGLLNRSNVNFFYNMGKFINSAISVSVILGTNSFEKQSLERFCFSSVENGNLCMSLSNELFGKGRGPAIPPGKLHFCLGIFRNVGYFDFVHYMQMIQTGDFKMFDYGSTENLVRYNSSTSPSYDISKITIPLTWILGENDHVVPKSGIVYAYDKFHKRNWDIYEMPYGHILFFLDQNADKNAYPILLRIINKFIK